MFNNRRPQGGPNGNNKKNDDDFKWKNGSKSLLFWVFLFVAIALFAILFPPGERDIADIDYSDYQKHLAASEIAKGEVIVRDTEGATEFVGTLKQPAYQDLATGKGR
ncbi:MAG TPA: hypothetical protein PKV71_14095, partial [Calditrichia bacterium]|nr:hypothetical protein [Calditrichia bacterium]